MEAVAIAVGFVAGLVTLIGATTTILARLGISLKVGGVQLGIEVKSSLLDGSLASGLHLASSRLTEVGHILGEAETAQSTLQTALTELTMKRKYVEEFLDAGDSKAVMDIIARSLQQRSLWVEISFLLASIVGSGVVGAVLGVALS